MLALDDVSAAYGLSPVLSAIGMRIETGESVALLGRNGVGKTTLLRTIIGLHAAGGGKISFDDKPITTLPAFRRAQLGIGYVPQGRDIFPQLTVEENLRIGAIALGRKANGSLDRVFSLFPILKEFLPRKGGMLSGGQQQQLAIGRALLTEPKILILDEPTEGIQPNIIDQIGEAIKLLRRGGHHNEAGLLANINQSIKQAREDGSVPKSPLFDEAAELGHVLLKEGVEKHPALFNRFAECIEALRKEQSTGTILADEIGTALKQLHGEAKISILLVEQYLDFCKDLADTFAIMDRGAVVCSGTVDGLTDDVVRNYLTV